MSLFAGPGILISLPGHEARAASWRGSVADVEEALGALKSRDLKLAMHVIHDAAQRRGVAVRCTPRPEVFDTLSARHSIFERAAGFDRHVCLSDGETLKSIAGLKNYVFFYQPAFQGAVSRLDRLRRRAPEIALNLRGQINSTLDFGTSGQPVIPPTIVLTGEFLPFRQNVTLRPFFFSDYSVEETLHRILQAKPPDVDELMRHKTLRYAPLTERALADPAFAQFLADMILDACFDPTVLLVLRAPFEPGGDMELTARIARVHEALSGVDVVIPRSRLSNILIADGDLSEDYPLVKSLPMSLYVPETFDFWRHTSKFYAQANRIVVLSGGDDTQRDVTVVYGARAERRRIGASAAK